MNSASHGCKERGSGKPILLAVLIMLALAGALGWFWLQKNPATQEMLIREGARILGNSLESIAGWRDKVGGPTPAPQVGSIAGSSLPGAPPKLSEQTATLSAKVDQALTSSSPQEGGAAVHGAFSTEVIPPVSEKTDAAPTGRKDDAVVRIAFIDDLANWMVKGFQPTRTGTLTTSIQEANLRYGVGIRGLARLGDDLPAGRSAALNYVFTADMLPALYQLYAPRFMEAVSRAISGEIDGKILSPNQKKAFYTLYARQFQSVSGALQGIAELPDFTARMDAQRRLAQNVVSTNARYAELVFARDEARAAGDKARAALLQQSVDEASHAYQNAVLLREQGRDQLAAAIRKNQGARTIDNDTLLYIAAWVERRIHNDPSRLAATSKAAQLFHDLSGRFDRAGQEVTR